MTTTTDTSAMTLAQKSDHILAKTRGLSGATPNATRLIEELRWALESNRNDVQRLTAERDEARRDAERWRDDALRLMKERNATQDERDKLVNITSRLVMERDEARREICRWAAARYRSEFQHYSTINAIAYAEKRGWRDAWREDKE